ncbi:hypothetical protein LLG96_14870 [bacterium]|nr:hypothetical protein [bacterium]
MANFVMSMRCPAGIHGDPEWIRASQPFNKNIYTVTDLSLTIRKPRVRIRVYSK